MQFAIQNILQGANYHPCKNIFSCFGDLVLLYSCQWSSVKQLHPYGCYIDFGGMTAILEFRSDTSKKAVISAPSPAFIRQATLELLVSILASLAKHDEMTVLSAPVSITPLHSMLLTFTDTSFPLPSE